MLWWRRRKTSGRVGGLFPAAVERLLDSGFCALRLPLVGAGAGLELVFIASVYELLPALSYDAGQDFVSDLFPDASGDTTLEYAPLLCASVGFAAREAKAHFDDIAARARPFFESPAWIRELASSVRWRPLFAYRFRRPAHINVLESVAYGTLIRNLAATRPSSRPVLLTDSRVNLGAGGRCQGPLILQSHEWPFTGRSSILTRGRHLSRRAPCQLGVQPRRRPIARAAASSADPRAAGLA